MWGLSIMERQQFFQGVNQPAIHHSCQGWQRSGWMNWTLLRSAGFNWFFFPSFLHFNALCFFFLWFTLQQHGKQLYSPSKADTEEKQLQQTDSDVSVCRQSMNSEIIKAHSEVIFASETQRSTFVMSQREQLNPTRCLDAEMWSPWFWPISIRHGVLVLVGSGKHVFLQDAPNKGLNVLFYAGLHIGELSVLLCLEFLS